jgi:type IX secretion system PorP/SprF family membrane protein
MISLSCLHAQDVFFTQSNSSPISLNPANAGSTGRGRLNVIYRNEWPKIPGNYHTTNVSYDHYFEKIHGGLALNYYHKSVTNGVFKNNGGSLGYAFRMTLMEDRLIIQPGISFGFINVSFDTSKVILTQPEQVFLTDKTAFDCAAGIMATTERFTFGFSMHHISKPDIGLFGESRLGMRGAVYASAIFGSTSQEFEKKFSFIPQVVYVQQYSFFQLDAGVSVKYGHWQLGTAFKYSSAVTGMLAYTNSHFRVSYGYDHSISMRTSVTGGIHEISLQLFMFPRKSTGIGFRDVGNYAF